MEILPEAFAIVKDTARRFTENPTLTVTAMQYDRDLAAAHDHITIEGDKAVWQNTWIAGGSPVTWDMVHYDVQLIGGIVLHQGKIAEMQTGEGKTLVATLPVFLNALAGQGVYQLMRAAPTVSTSRGSRASRSRKGGAATSSSNALRKKKCA